MKKIVALIALALPILMAAQWATSASEVETVDLSAVTAPQTQIRWMTIEEAQAAMKQEKRKILVDVYTDWCGPCKMMMRNTFSNASVIKYINETYYAVKFNAEGPKDATWKGVKYVNPNHDPSKAGRNGTHQFTYQIAPIDGRVAYPTLTFIDEDLNVLTPVAGYRTPAQLEPLLKFFGDDHYKTTQYEEYVKSFESEF